MSQTHAKCVIVYDRFVHVPIEYLIYDVHVRIECLMTNECRMSWVNVLCRRRISNVVCRMPWANVVRMLNFICQMLYVGRQMSYDECSALNVECRILNFECREPNAECRMLNVESQMMNVGCRRLTVEC